jgi:hypothetical protein
MFLAAVCAALTFKFPFSSGNVVVGANGHVFRSLTAARSVTILLITVILIVGILYNIFNYKVRSRQILVNAGLILLSFLNIFLYYHESLNYIEYKIALGAILTIIIPLLLILAIRGIARDNKLVKSADRLR